MKNCTGTDIGDSLHSSSTGRSCSVRFSFGSGSLRLSLFGVWLGSGSVGRRPRCREELHCAAQRCDPDQNRDHETCDIIREIREMIKMATSDWTGSTMLLLLLTVLLHIHTSFAFCPDGCACDEDLLHVTCLRSKLEVNFV